jgi:tRNA A-37 threonylcarbamoyl transferase component Bud32
MAMLAVGQQMGDFTIEQELGSGAMGTVYKVTYLPKRRTMALKVIAFGLTGNETAINRFEREAEILKQLKHPNIVRFHATGRYKGTPFFAMEFVEGESLDNVLARRLRFSWEEVVSVAKQVFAALQHAHDKGIVHRDLKPSNLMRLEDGTVKLTDFGIAKDLDRTQLTGANCTVGTAAYMSPEQCRGETTITSKSDLYSMGVVMFELLTGRKPFTAESPVEMFRKHVEDPAPRPNWSLKGTSSGEIPTWLETIVLQLLEKKPEHRPLNAGIVAQALEDGMQKFYAGQSAAVDAVQAKVGERRIQTSVLDETDREAARTLRGAIQKKKFRKKTSGGFNKAFIIIPAAILLLLVFVGLIWLVARPPSAESLYRQAERKMAKPDTYVEALYRIDGRDGPVREFLRRYPEHELAPKVREWQDQAETTDLFSRIKHNASGPKFKKGYLDWEKVPPEYEPLAFNALRHEEYGDYYRANTLWHQAMDLAAKDEEYRVATRLAELQMIHNIEAWKAEQTKEPDRYMDEKTSRITLLERKLAEAKKLGADHRKLEQKKLVDETKELYGADDDKDVKKLVAQITETFYAKSDEKKDDERKDGKKDGDKKDESKDDKKKDDK